MAIKIEFIELVMKTKKATQYFPQLLGKSYCYSDGVICNPMGVMSSNDIPYLKKSCMDHGLKRFIPNNPDEKIPPMQGDYAILSHWDMKSSLELKDCNWLHFHLGVAWNPEHPMGIHCPTTFPCFFGGFYYDSAETWQKAENAITSYTANIDSPLENVIKMDSVSGLMDLLPIEPYACFFDCLGHKTLLQKIKNNIDKNIRP